MHFFLFSHVYRPAFLLFLISSLLGTYNLAGVKLYNSHSEQPLPFNRPV